MHKAKILIVDDDRQICELVINYLTKHNMQVYNAWDKLSMQRMLQSKNIDLIILDIMLPGTDGITLCQELRRESNVLIIMLSAIGEEADRVMSLEIGADDYLTKPFSLRELLARIKSLLRRTQGELAQQQNKYSKQIILKFAGWTFDLAKHFLLAPDGITVTLTRAEHELLLAFLERPQKVLTREQLLDLISDREAGLFDRSIDVLIGRLRKKIETDIRNPQFIITVRGIGYKFAPEVKKE